MSFPDVDTLPVRWYANDIRTGIQVKYIYTYCIELVVGITAEQ